MNDYIDLWAMFFAHLEDLTPKERDAFVDFMAQASKPQIKQGD